MIEGYYFKIKDNSIFCVKGVEHPLGKIIAFPKYVESENGDRKSINGVKYRKLSSLKEQLNYVYRNYSQFLTQDNYFNMKIPQIPVNDVIEVFNPINKTKELMRKDVEGIEYDVKEFINKLTSVINYDNIGVSGSALVNLHTENSDIDLVIYSDMDKLLKIREKLLKEYEKGILKKLSKDLLLKTYNERVGELPLGFKEFKVIQERKILEGVFNNRKYFIRLIKTPVENTYGKLIYKRRGCAIVKAEVLDDEESILTPCRYLIKTLNILKGGKVDVSEIYSLRGRFCEIASKGEIIIAKGLVEEVINVKERTSKYRLHLGYPGSYLMPKSRW